MLRIELSYDAGAYKAAINSFDAAVLQVGMVDAVNRTAAAVQTTLQRAMLNAFDRLKSYTVGGADVHSMLETSRIAVTYGPGASRIDVEALDDQIGTSLERKRNFVY